MPAQTGIIDGGDIIVAIDATAIAHSTSCKISTSTSFRERRTKDTAGTQRVPDEVTTGISVESLTTYGTYSYFDLLAKQKAKAAVLIKYKPKVAQEGDQFLEGNFYIESLERNDPVAEDSTMSVSFVPEIEPELKTEPAA